MSESLSNLLAAAHTVTAEVQTHFGHLTPQQLNWKPDANQWSIAQCFEHLIAANESYFPTFEQVLTGRKQTTLWQRVPLLPSLFGKLVAQAVSPEAARKLKAPKIYTPASSNVDDAIIRRFVERQEQVIKYMNAMKDLPVEKIIISSPVTDLITYSLLDACRIIVNHEQRHLLQAKRVLRQNEFPK